MQIIAIVMLMELKTVRAITIPENGNIIVGQSHFIKTVEDIYEAIVNTLAPYSIRHRFQRSFRTRASLAWTATTRR